MINVTRIVAPLILLTLLVACTVEKAKVDSIYYNAVVYTVDPSFSSVEAFAVDSGKILATGTLEELELKYLAGDKIDLAGKAVFPGFIDAH
ncbi:MAG: amidohydrolase, partial [Bacteroidetes bacterium]|nr:amidohydrolase [Bacteroidota bacterium]